MVFASQLAASDIWLDEIFASRAAQNCGVIQRSVRDVERKVGRERLELEVRQRGFHLIECESQMVIVCATGRINVIMR